MSTCERIKDLETDLAESEDRTAAEMAALKKELRSISEVQSLHSEVLLRLLGGHPMYDPERERLARKIKRAKSSCGQCS